MSKKSVWGWALRHTALQTCFTLTNKVMTMSHACTSHVNAHYTSMLFIATFKVPMEKCTFALFPPLSFTFRHSSITISLLLLAVSFYSFFSFLWGSTNTRENYWGNPVTLSVNFYILIKSHTLIGYSISNNWQRYKMYHFKVCKKQYKKIWEVRFRLSSMSSELQLTAALS